MTQPRGMTENKRAFLALGGAVFPRVGERGIFSEGFEGIIDAEFADDAERTVEVLRVSESGKTIWTRFVHPEGSVRFGGGKGPQRWQRGEGNYYWGIHVFGEVRFR